MGNTNRKSNVVNKKDPDSFDASRHRVLDQSFSEFSRNLSGRSFVSVSSHHSTYSVSRPWSRVSRRRWKESTLTVPFEACKTAWPVSHIESCFLPNFPLLPSFYENNFLIIEALSHGAFGKVFKVKEKGSEKLFALKVLSKSQIIRENAVQQVKDEVQIQRVCGHHPFIVSCPIHWQSRKRLYIVTEFIEGGELFTLCESYGALPLQLVQIYVAEIALALDFLHNAGIIYRDLKPENVLLDGEAHVQLADFGLSKWLRYGERTGTVCGTLRYMAPEVISVQPYGHAVDWWSLGVVACLMLTAKFPMPVVAGALSQSAANARPGTLPDDCELDMKSRDLLLRLLEVEPIRRLKSLRVLQGIAFYMGFNFEHVKERKFNPREMIMKHPKDMDPVTVPDKTDVELENFNICIH